MLQKITALRQQKRDARRVNVYLDGRYAFALQAPLADAVQVGQTLSPEEIDELQRKDVAEVAFQRVLQFLSYRPRSQAEVEAYLQRRKVTPAVRQEVMDRLVQARLLDDQEFARYWVENREVFRPRGVYSLRFELRSKGVDEVTIQRAVEGLDEADSAYRAAAERARRLKGLGYADFRRRLAGFLQRRGFGYDITKDTVDRLWREAQGSEQGESS